MKRILTIKGAIVLGVAAMLLAGAAIYAQQVFNVNLTGNLTLVISGDAIQVYEGDGVTPINTGGALNFGTVSVDFFGNAPEPVYGLLYVKNLANVRVEVSVTGDLRDSILPLWGSTRETLQPYPDNAAHRRPRRPRSCRQRLRLLRFQRGSPLPEGRYGRGP